MAALGQVFDANNVEPARPMELIPAGDYLAHIVDSQMRDTKNGKGQYLWMEIAVLEGPYIERRLFDRLNLINQNESAAEIASRTLSSICHAIGKLQVSDSEQLHYQPFIVKVSVKPAGEDKGGVMREAQNEIKGYKAASGGGAATTAPRTAPRAAAAAPAAAPAPAPAAPKSAPWRKAS